MEQSKVSHLTNRPTEQVLSPSTHTILTKTNSLHLVLSLTGTIVQKKTHLNTENLLTEV